MNRLQILRRNPHTSGAAALILGCMVGSIWFPEFADKFEKTSQLFFAYGLLMAGDAGAAERKSLSQQNNQPPKPCE